MSEDKKGAMGRTTGKIGDAPVDLLVKQDCCSVCAHFTSESDENPSDENYEDYGPCRRYPPVYAPSEDDDVLPWEWSFIERANKVRCGEFKRLNDNGNRYASIFAGI